MSKSVENEKKNAMKKYPYLSLLESEEGKLKIAQEL